MNGFDLGLLVVLGVLVVVGMAKGLVRILVGLLALVTAFFVASHYHAPLAERLDRLSVPPEALRLGAWAGLFLGVMLLGGVIAWFARKLLRVAMLGWADRVAGGAVGLAAGVLACALGVLPVITYAPEGTRYLAGSRSAPYVAAVAEFALWIVPDAVAERYRDGLDALRRASGRSNVASSRR